jgi:hypothetical protein
MTVRVHRLDVVFLNRFIMDMVAYFLSGSFMAALSHSPPVDPQVAATKIEASQEATLNQFEKEAAAAAAAAGEDAAEFAVPTVATADQSVTSQAAVTAAADAVPSTSGLLIALFDINVLLPEHAQSPRGAHAHVSQIEYPIGLLDKCSQNMAEVWQAQIKHAGLQDHVVSSGATGSAPPPISFVPWGIRSFYGANKQWDAETANQGDPSDTSQDHIFSTERVPTSDLPFDLETEERSPVSMADEEMVHLKNSFKNAVSLNSVSEFSSESQLISNASYLPSSDSIEWTNRWGQSAHHPSQLECGLLTGLDFPCLTSIPEANIPVTAPLTTVQQIVTALPMPIHRLGVASMRIWLDGFSIKLIDVQVMRKANAGKRPSAMSLPNADSFESDGFFLMAPTRLCVALYFGDIMTVGLWSDQLVDILASDAQYKFIMSMTAGNLTQPGKLKMNRPTFLEAVAEPVTPPPRKSVIGTPSLVATFVLVLDVAHLKATFCKGSGLNEHHKLVTVSASPLLLNLSMNGLGMNLECDCKNLVIKDQRHLLKSHFRNIIQSRGHAAHQKIETLTELVVCMHMNSQRGLALTVDLNDPAVYFMQLALIWQVLAIFSGPAVPPTPVAAEPVKDSRPLKSVRIVEADSALPASAATAVRSVQEEMWGEEREMGSNFFISCAFDFGCFFVNCERLMCCRPRLSISTELPVEAQDLESPSDEVEIAPALAPAPAPAPWAGMCLRLFLKRGELWLVEQLNNHQSDALCVGLPYVEFDMRIRPLLGLRMCCDLMINIEQRIPNVTGHAGTFSMRDTHLFFTYAMYSQSKAQGERRLAVFDKPTDESDPPPSRTVNFNCLDISLHSQSEMLINLSGNLECLMGVIATVCENLWGGVDPPPPPPPGAAVAVAPPQPTVFNWMDLNVHAKLEQLKLVFVDRYLGHAFTLLQVTLSRVDFVMDAINFVQRYMVRLDPLKVDFFNYRRQKWLPLLESVALKVVFKMAQKPLFIPEDRRPIGTDISLFADRGLNINVVAMGVEHIMRLIKQLNFKPLKDVPIDWTNRLKHHQPSKYMIKNQSGFTVHYRVDPNDTHLTQLSHGQSHSLYFDSEMEINPVVYLNFSVRGVFIFVHCARFLTLFGFDQLRVCIQSKLLVSPSHASVASLESHPV